MIFALKILAYGGTILLAVMGTAVTLNPARPHSSRQKVWLACFAIGGLITFVSSMWLSERQDADLELKLTGGDNYVYLIADRGALRNRTNPFRIWVCSTGPMFDVKIHPWPFGKTVDDPEYVSMGAAADSYLPEGCKWAPFAFKPGKYWVELEGRNGTALETLEIMAPDEGPFTQKCGLQRNGISLATSECH